MGVEWSDCMDVAKLLGMKTFINEFVAYEELSKYIKNRKECLDGPTISVSLIGLGFRDLQLSGSKYIRPPVRLQFWVVWIREGFEICAFLILHIMKV